MLRWLVEHGPPVGLPVAMKLVMEFGYVEIASWLSEDIRVQIVLEALQTDKRELLCWVLMRTQFDCEESFRLIRDGVQCAPNTMLLWFQENLVDSTECKWCPTIWQSEESEVLRPAKIRRRQ
ncbi:hypothetical protein PHMEG_0002195 [Phytophthora megakarya]|uniref:Uncharacterized protein n=1 Tax=Phytophthora megakarya TaxID=4795 RepID=A0A225WZ51_9STRA|nr:hypothetical protein PHMEG_0002195 [Phytophthora megakarya]